MKAFLAVLVVVLGAAAAWLWLRDRPEPPATNAALTRTAPPDAGSIGTVTDPARPTQEPGTALTRAGAPEDVPDAAAMRESRADASESAPRRRLMQDGGYIEARRKLFRLMTSGRYPDIERVLGLSPETANRLFDVLTEHRAQYGGQIMEDEDADPAESALARQERDNALNSAIVGAIGKAKMPDYEQYMGSIRERYTIRDLQFTLMNSPHPLVFEDAESVIEAMYEERRRIERELTETYGASEENEHYPPAFVVDGQKIAELHAGANQRIFNAAAIHLSSEQAQQFRFMLDEVIELNRLGDEMRRIRSEARSGNTVND